MAVHVHESRGGLAPADYRASVLAHSSKIFAALEPYKVPRIHFGVGTGELLGLMGEAGLSALLIEPGALLRGDHADQHVEAALQLLRVLEYLVEAEGAVVSAEELLEHVWDAHADPFSNTVAVTVARLRRKLGDPPLIETVVGVGYRL